MRCRGGVGGDGTPGPQPGSPPRVPRRAVGWRHQQGQHCSRWPRVPAPTAGVAGRPREGGGQGGLRKGGPERLWAFPASTSQRAGLTAHGKEEVKFVNARDPCSSLQGTAWVPNYPGYANFLPRRLVPGCVQGPWWLHLLPIPRVAPAHLLGPAAQGTDALSREGMAPPGRPLTPGTELRDVASFLSWGRPTRTKSPGTSQLRFPPSSLGPCGPEPGLSKHRSALRSGPQGAPSSHFFCQLLYFGALAPCWRHPVATPPWVAPHESWMPSQGLLLSPSSSPLLPGEGVGRCSRWALLSGRAASCAASAV